MEAIAFGPNFKHHRNQNGDSLIIRPADDLLFQVFFYRRLPLANFAPLREIVVI
jgi:hypothetical protein